MMDFIRECNQFEVSSEDFERLWCFRCRNQECRRCRSEQAAWVHRIATQQDSLFNPPRADDQDPQYDDIRSKTFRCLNPQEGVPTVQYPIVINSPAPSQFMSSTSDNFVKPGAVITLKGT